MIARSNVLNYLGPSLLNNMGSSIAAVQLHSAVLRAVWIDNNHMSLWQTAKCKVRRKAQVFGLNERSPTDQYAKLAASCIMARCGPLPRTAGESTEGTKAKAYLGGL